MNRINKHNKDIVSQLISNNTPMRRATLSKFPNIVEEIENYPINSDNMTFSNKVYNWYHELQSVPTCPNTGNPTKYANFKKGYKKYAGRGSGNRGVARKSNSSKLKKAFSERLKVEPKPVTLTWYSNKLKEFNTTNYGAFITSFTRKYPREYLFLKNMDMPLPEITYRCLHSIHETPVCQFDGISDCHFKGYTKGYSRFSKKNIRKGRNKVHLDELKCIVDYYDEQTTIDLTKSFIKNLDVSDQNLYYTLLIRDKKLLASIIHHTETFNVPKFSNKVYILINGKPKKDKPYHKLHFHSLSHGYKTRFESKSGTSEGEKELFEWLSGHVSDLRKDRSILNGKEIDMVSDEHKMGVEYNGLYWHSDKFKDKMEFYNKTKLANSKGYDIIHINEHEWHQNKNLVKSLILSKFGKSPNRIFARKCIISEIDYKTCETFLNENHMQGNCRSSFRYGLFLNDHLVAVMTFGKRNINGKVRLELLRYCSEINTTVVGGAGKLLKYFISNENPTEIISYSNSRYSNGGMYDALGFKFEHESSPNYYYFKPMDAKKITLLHRANFQKHKLASKLDNFDPNKTEVDNMYDNGYRRIFDCGHKLYTLKL